MSPKNKSRRTRADYAAFVHLPYSVLRFLGVGFGEGPFFKKAPPRKPFRRLYFTVTTHVAVLPLAVVTVMVAVPRPTPRTLPLASTVATFSLLEAKVKRL